MPRWISLTSTAGKARSFDKAGYEIMKWYSDGMKISFTPCHESNTGPRAINEMAVIDVPEWVSRRVNIGETISMQNIDGVLHWYIEVVEVFQ